MPFKTEYGTHYHMTEGCHGATIPCGTEGLTPCADCCGNGRGAGASGGGAGGVAVGGGSPSMPAGAYADDYGNAAGDTPAEVLPEMRQVEAQWESAFASEEASEHKAVDDFERAQRVNPLAPSGMADSVMSSPSLAKHALSQSDQVIESGRRAWHNLPVIGFIGEGITTTLGGLSLSLRARWQEHKQNKAISEVQAREGCSDWEARSLIEVERGERLARTRKAAEEAIQRQMAWDKGRGRQRTRDDIVIDSILRTCQRVKRRWGVTWEESLSGDGILGLSNAIYQAIEESGYGDKITTETIHRMKHRLNVPFDRTRAVTLAMEDARDNERFRTVDAPKAIAKMRERQRQEGRR